MEALHPKTRPWKQRFNQAIDSGDILPGWGRRALSTTARRALATGARSDSISLVFTGVLVEELR